MSHCLKQAEALDKPQIGRLRVHALHIYKRDALLLQKKSVVQSGPSQGSDSSLGLVSEVARGPSARRPGSKNLRNQYMTARVCRDHPRFRRNAQAVAEQVRVPSHIHGPNRSKNLY